MDNKPTDISKVTDITSLKALGYDLVSQLEQTQNNLRLVNQRIAELQEPAVEKSQLKKK